MKLQLLAGQPSRTLKHAAAALYMCCMYLLKLSYGMGAVFWPFFSTQVSVNGPPPSVNARAPVNASRRPLTRRRASTDTPRRSTEYYVRYYADFIANGRRRTANVLPPPLTPRRPPTDAHVRQRTPNRQPTPASGNRRQTVNGRLRRATHQTRQRTPPSVAGSIRQRI